MSLSKWLFEVFPYLCVVAAVVGTWLRFRSRRFSVSSLSSQFLENGKLFWGSVPWHYGILVVLSGHFLLFLFPSYFSWVTSDPRRLQFFEMASLGFGLLSVWGGLVLLFRRMTDRRVKVVTNTMDLVILVLLIFQVSSGVLIAMIYRWGSSWYAASMVPYLRSLVWLQPDSSFVASMPWLVKAHITGAFLIIATVPFSRLVHFLSVPIGYLWRSPQVVIWNRKKA